MLISLLHQLCKHLYKLSHFHLKYCGIGIGIGTNIGIGIGKNFGIGTPLYNARG